MANSKMTKIITDEKGNESILLRGDTTLKEMMVVEPSSRWNAIYWHPIYAKNIEELSKSPYEIIQIGEFETRLTYGAIVTGHTSYAGKDLYLLNQGQILFTGLDHYSARMIRSKSPWNRERAKPNVGTILLARSGVAGVGRNRITIMTEPIKAVVDSFVDILDVDPQKINPFYVVVFWKTKYGWLQIERIINGVGTVNISFDEIRSVQIPILPNSVQAQIEALYRVMAKNHGGAILANHKGDKSTFDGQMKTAETLLRELILKTEAVIRGEKKDVI